jgi:hypothetical protein
MVWNMVQCSDLINTVIYIPLAQKAKNFFNSFATISFSKSTLHHKYDTIHTTRLNWLIIQLLRKPEKELLQMLHAVRKNVKKLKSYMQERETP